MELMNCRTKTQDFHMIEQTELHNLSGDCARRDFDRK